MKGKASRTAIVPSLSLSKTRSTNHDSELVDGDRDKIHLASSANRSGMQLSIDQPGAGSHTVSHLFSLRARDIVLILSVNGRIVEANDAAVSAYLYDRDSLLSMHISDLGAASETVRLSPRGPDGHEHGTRFETMHRRADGSEFPVEVVSSRTILGGEIFVLSVVRDISDRKHLEMRLRRHASLLDLATEPILAWHLDGAIIFWNKGAENLYGYSAAEALGKTSHQLLQADYARNSEFLEILHRDRAWKGELRQTTKSGLKLVVESHQQLLEEKDGRWLVLECNRDITERNGAITALARSEEKLRISLEAANMGTWDWDMSSGELVWDDRCRALFGLDPGRRMTYERFLAAIHPRDRGHIDQAVQEALTLKKPYDVEMRVSLPSGSMRWIRSKGSVLHDSMGRPIRMSGCALDITDQKEDEEALQLDITHRKRAEEDLRRAHSDLEDKVRERTGELAAVNESLRVLTGRLLQLQDDERRRLSRELHDSAGQMLVALNMNCAALANEVSSPTGERLIADTQALLSQMTSEIRTMSYLLHPPLLDEVGLDSALRWYIDGFARRSGIDTELDVSADFGRLAKEKEITLFRVVQESLTNVLRHSGSCSASVRLNREPEQVQLEIRDSGKGISPQGLARVDIGKSEGVGLGGMRERIRQLGGEFHITSSAQGTTILAILPAA